MKHIFFNRLMIILTGLSLGPILSACDTLSDLTSFEGMPIIGENITYPCPVVRIPLYTDRVTKYRDTRVRDYIDIVYDANIEPLFSKCEWDIDSNTRAGSMEMTLNLSFNAYRGKANTNATIKLDYFVTLTDADENIISKQNFTLDSDFPGAGQQAQFIEEPIVLNIPIGPNQNNTDFQVFTGIQLTREDLLENKRQQQEKLR